MRKFVFSNKNNIPGNRMEDVKELQKFIRFHMDIDISLSDTYRLWDSISKSWSAGWLSIDTHPVGETREEFLESEMEKRGYLVDISEF